MKSLSIVVLLFLLYNSIGAQYYKTLQEAEIALRSILQTSSGPATFTIGNGGSSPPGQATAPGTHPLTVGSPPPMVAPGPPGKPPKSAKAPKAAPLAPSDYGDYNGEITPAGIRSTPGSAPVKVPISGPDLEQLQQIQSAKQNQSSTLAQQQGLQAQYSGPAESNTLNPSDLKEVQSSFTDPPVPQYNVPGSCGSLSYKSAYAAIAKLDQFYYYKVIIDQLDYLGSNFYKYLAYPSVNITMFAPTNIAIQKTAYSLGYTDVYTFLTDDGATAVRNYIALYSIINGQVDLGKQKYFSNTTFMLNQDPSNTTSAVKFQCGGGFLKYANITVQNKGGKNGATIQDGLSVNPFDALNKKAFIQTCGAFIYPTNVTLLPCDPYTTCVTAMDQITTNFGNATEFLQFISASPGIVSLLQDTTWRGTVFIPQDSGVQKLLQTMQNQNLPTDQSNSVFQTFQEQIASFHIIEGAIIYLDPNNVANSTINQTSTNPSIVPTNLITTMQNFTYCYSNESDASSITPAGPPTADNPKTLPKLTVSKAPGSATGQIYSTDDGDDKAQVLLTDLVTCNGVIQIVNQFAIPCKLPTISQQTLSFGGAPTGGSGASSNSLNAAKHNININYTLVTLATILLSTLYLVF